MTTLNNYNIYKDKYPEIVIDKRENAVNGNNTIIKLTVEDMTNILHHTHNITDIIGYESSTGGAIDYGIIKRIEALELSNAQMIKEINLLKEQNENLLNIINSFKLIDKDTGESI